MTGWVPVDSIGALRNLLLPGRQGFHLLPVLLRSRLGGFRASKTVGRYGSIIHIMNTMGTTETSDGEFKSCVREPIAGYLSPPIAMTFGMSLLLR